MAEEPKNDAFIHIFGKVAYCSQSSPIFSSTIRENITFFKQYDKEKYDRIVDICCLLPDFETFNAKDETEVGSRGVTLSGGQRARISLARAIYNDADIYLLDDPLSAVDAHVGRRIWNEVILNYLHNRGKTVLIASHQVHYFEDCNRILTIDNGKIVNDEVGVEKVESTQTQEENTMKKNDQKAEKKGDGKLTTEEKLASSGNISGKTYAHYICSGKVALFAMFVVCIIIA